MSSESLTAEIFVSNLARNRACSLIEIASAYTGWPFSENLPIRGFALYSRFIYAPNSHDGSQSRHSDFPDLDALSINVQTFPATFDIAFLDPWHEITDSLRVLEIALDKMRPGATLIMHDCHPHDAELRRANRSQQSLQPWSGSTWAAWSLTTKSLSHEFSWMTIDSDHGIGVLKVPETSSHRRRLVRLLRSLSKQWTAGVLLHPEWSAEPDHLHLVKPTDPRVSAWV